MTQVKKFQFAGGRLCLDFANTVDNRRSPQAVDQIDIYEDVIEWTQQAGILSARDAQQIVRASANNQMYFGIHDYGHDYGGTYGTSPLTRLNRLVHLVATRKRYSALVVSTASA